LEVNHQKKGCVLEKKRLYEEHLGNVRVSYKNTSTTGVNLAIVEENNYYPFGLKHKGYNNQMHRLMTPTTQNIENSTWTMMQTGTCCP
jgi:hypothetical protein